MIEQSIFLWFRDKRFPMKKREASRLDIRGSIHRQKSFGPYYDIKTGVCGYRMGRMYRLYITLCIKYKKYFDYRNTMGVLKLVRMHLRVGILFLNSSVGDRQAGLSGL